MKSLPTTAVFSAVDSDLLATSRAHIFREFEELLLRGKQVESLPGDVMAAGQYLIPFEINQRGLYGTAAAISVVTHSDSSAKTDLLTRLIRYLSRRTDVENVIATSTSDWAMLAGRLEREIASTFKNADVLSALANVSTLIPGRDAQILELNARLDSGRLTTGGWPAILGGTDMDPVATASAIRARLLIGESVAPQDRAILERSANDRALNIYERVYCAFVCVEAGWSSALSTWEELRDQLDPQLADRREHLHQYRQGDRWEYIHIPWEIYYVRLGLALEGVRWVLRPRVQRWLLGAISDVMSDGGYSYERPGVKSTRTYAALMEMLTDINRLTSTSFTFNQLASLWNGISRAYFSRFLRVLLFIAGVGLAVVSIVDWLRGPTSSLGDLGPNLVAPVVILLLALWRRRQ